MADSFTNLQNGFYNGLCQGLGLSQDTFQIIQPSPPLPANNDNALWNYFNAIPPYSLTQQYVASGGNLFFTDYQGLISALVAPPNTFQQDIGDETYQAWMTYLRGLNPIPASTQLPSMFLNWAIIYAPSVANKGAADLSAMLLDPISAAGLALMPYLGPPPRQPDWSLGYTTLMEQLANAPSQSFTFDSNTMNSNVSSSWTQGGDTGLFGLWGSSSSTSTLSEQFASSQVTIAASFAHVFTFQATPGVWYNSSAMGDAYSHQSGAPWNPNSTINWQNTFDSQSGNMARFMTSLIVVDEMNISVQSSATYSSEEQQTIKSSSSAGLWPFYTSGGGSSSQTTVTFDSAGAMTVEITSQPNVPIVIGGNVIPVAQFVGHAVEGSRQYAALAHAAD